MMTLVMILCLNSVCVEKAPFDPMPSFACKIRGQMIIAEWLQSNMIGYSLDSYKCTSGKRIGA